MILPFLSCVGYYPFGTVYVHYTNLKSISILGEQVHILASLSAYKQDTEIITPFKVAAVMSKNGIGQSPKKQNGDLEDGSDFVTAQGK